MQKVFTTIPGVCPLKGCTEDSQPCRACEFYYRAGTGTFFWCRRPLEPPAPEPEKRKRGRPKGSKSQKPVKRAKSGHKKSNQ